MTRMRAGLKKVTRAIERASKASLGAAEVQLLRLFGLEPRYPPLFLVGAPRCGTTLPYLYLTNRFKVAYIPNGARKVPQAPATMGVVSRLVGSRGGFGHESRYGAVEGLSAPSDGWEIFHRWFPRYALAPICHERISDLSHVVGAYERIFDGPFMNKNNHNSVRIPALNDVFPNAVFVHVTRNLVDSGVSLLEARRKHGVGPNEPWSCPAPGSSARTFDSDADYVVSTIIDIQRCIRTELERLPPTRWLEISYEDFCASPKDFGDWVEGCYPKGLLQTRHGFEEPILAARSDTHASSGELRKAIESAVDRITRASPSSAATSASSRTSFTGAD